MTISAESLSPEHLKAAGVSSKTAIVGTDSGREFSRAILGNEAELDIEAARQDMLEAGARLVEKDPALGAILLECTNMVPFAADLRAAFGLPVYSIYSFVQWFQAGLLPRRFANSLDDPRF